MSMPGTESGAVYRTSPTTPTTRAVSVAKLPIPRFTGFPIGSSSGHRRLAAVSPTSTTFGAFARSASVNARSRTTGTRIIDGQLALIT